MMLYWQWGQHLSCKSGSCSHSCRSCTSADLSLPSPAPRCRHRQCSPAPAKTPWPSAPLGGGGGVDFCIFVTLVLAPALCQLPYCIPSCKRFPWRSVCQNRSDCVFCWGQKGCGITRPPLPHSFSSHKAFPEKARGVFSRAAGSSRGLIKPATLAMVWVSAMLLHDIWLTGQDLAVLCCPADKREKQVLQLSQEGKPR